MSDVLTLAALVCFVIAGFLWALIAGVVVLGIALFVLSLAYADAPLPRLRLPRLLPRRKALR